MQRTAILRKTPLRRTPFKKAVKKKAVKSKKRVVNHQPKLWTMKKADRLFSIYIRTRDRNCFFCPNPASQNSHYWGRGNKGTRYDPLNCDGICGGCHMKHEGSKQGLYRDMKIEQLGLEVYEAMERRARGTTKLRDAIVECMEYLASVT